MDFVLDCSTTMAFFFKDEISFYSDYVFEALADNAKALVPAIWPLEIANVCLIAERRKRIQLGEIKEIIDILSTFPIYIVESAPVPNIMDVISFSRKYDLTSYDASYLAIAKRERITIATLDKKLKETAKKARVRIFTP